jgi:hypothetical protein
MITSPRLVAYTHARFAGKAHSTFEMPLCPGLSANAPKGAIPSAWEYE